MKHLLYIPNTVVFFVLFFVLLGCEKDDNENCLDFRNSFVTSVEAPKFGTINEDIQIPLRYQVINGCASFNRFKESTSNNITTIEVEVKYEGCRCNQGAGTRGENYIYRASSAGEYELRFRSSPADFIEVTIVIE